MEWVVSSAMMEVCSFQVAILRSCLLVGISKHQKWPWWVMDCVLFQSHKFILRDSLSITMPCDVGGREMDNSSQQYSFLH